VHETDLGMVRPWPGIRGSTPFLLIGPQQVIDASASPSPSLSDMVASPSLSDMMVVAVEARSWRHCDCDVSGGAVMAVAGAAHNGAMMILFSRAEFTKFCLLCLFVVCSSWLYRSTYNTLEDMIEFWQQMVRNLMTHFPSQHN
jgi:hypothetical protein